jgi:hypothetical protein
MWLLGGEGGCHYIAYDETSHPNQMSPLLYKRWDVIYMYLYIYIWIAHVQQGWEVVVRHVVTRESHYIAYEEVVAGPPPSGLSNPVLGAVSTEAGTRDVVVLHGLLGSGRNWRSLSRRLAQAAAETYGGCAVRFKPHWSLC